MKNPVNIKRPYQFRVVMLRHITTVGIMILVELLIFGPVFAMPHARYAAGVFFTLIYCFSLYGCANRLASNDMKPYTPLEPKPKFGLCWGLVISVLTLMVYVVYRINWMFFAVDGQMTNAVSVVINVFYFFWTAPYFGFFDAAGVVPMYAVIMMLALPPIMTFFGYYTGYKKIDIYDKLLVLTFEKSDKSKE